ncbi:hypothetical protein HNR16_001243 [Pseudoclavibacter chungangensis]|nr:nucleotide pyrophosphatase/phosphodiesterase family protein [Pseudoclavibacter chungangensis]NYJ66455.1 hypothetical protein [Pseudoclavibacter chungangensis]
MLLSGASGRPTLADVLPNCLDALQGVEGPLALPAARSAVVLLVDGLGASMLRRRAGHARHIMSGWAKRDTAFSFPSTTVAGTTSLTTAAPAGVHGLVGYTVYDRAAGIVRNQLHGWDVDGMEPAHWQPAPTVFERLAAAGGPEPYVVAQSDYTDSGLTRASLRGATYVVGESMADRVEATLDLVAAGQPRLVYCYVAELDQAGHRYGWESDEWLIRLEELDAAVGDLVAGLPRDVGLLVTADHGMLDIPPERQILVDEDSPLLDGVVAVAGEPRLRHLALDDDASADPASRAAHALAERWRESEGKRATVLLREEAIASGWYGDPALVTPAAASRVGDVVVAATKLVTYYPPGVPDRARLMIGQHGSITPEETIVPLIRKGAFARV